MAPAPRAVSAHTAPTHKQSAHPVRTATGTSRLGLGLGAVALALLVALPAWGDYGDLRAVVEIAYFIVLAQLWNLLAGYTGLVSIGQQAYVGLGGYALFVLAIYGGVHPIAAIVLSGALAALVAVPTALVVFRLRGAYFAIGTWVVAEVYRLLFAQVSALGGGSGQSLPVQVIRDMAESRLGRELLVYYTALGLAVGCVLGLYAMLRSRSGLALTAIRDSERAASGIGVDTFRTKLWVYLAAAFGTGAVGALIFLQKLRISPDAAFAVGDWTANVIFIVVIGGIGTLEGPLVGALIFFALRAALADFGSWYLIVMGAIAITFMLKAPQGVWGLLAQRFDLHFFPVRRRLRDDVLRDGE